MVQLITTHSAVEYDAAKCCASKTCYINIPRVNVCMSFTLSFSVVAYRGGWVWGVQTPPPPEIPKALQKSVPNSTRLWKLLKKTSSVYDCTVEDVEYICNSNSTLCFLYCCCYNVSIVTHSRHLVVVMLRCCARRRDGALERLRGDVIDLPYKPPNITKP